jgi:hypothetical protein
MQLVRNVATMCLTFACAAPALAQQQHAEPKILEVTGSAQGVTSWRRVETRTTTGGVTVVTTAVQSPGIEGGWETRHETSTETIDAGSGTTRVREDVYVHSLQRAPVLLERTETEQVRSRDGLQSMVQTSTADLDGHLVVTSQSVEERRSDSGATENTSRLLARDVNGTLADVAQTTVTERQRGAGTINRESSVMRRDLNGQWQPIEVRQTDVQGDGGAEQQEEEIVSQPDMNGVIGISERVVTRRSQGKGGEDVLIERYTPRDPGARHRSTSRMELSERTRVSTTTAANGTRETIEEVEARSPVAAADPLRVQRRTVTTVRPLGGDRSVIEQQIYELDPNGRLVLTATERREGAAQ